MQLQNPFSRRTVRGVWLGGIAATGGAALLISSMPAFADADDKEPPFAASCEVTILPGSEDTGEGIVRTMDESGTYFGGMTDDDADFPKAALWEDGELSYIDFAATGEEFSEGNVNGINGHGDAVGYAYFEELDGRQAYTYIDGEAALVPAPDGWETVEITAINDDGVLVGYLTNADSQDTPVSWETPDSDPKELPLPDDTVSSRAHDLDNDGQIIGYYSSGPDDARDVTTYLWDADGEGQALTEDIYAHGMSVNGEWIGGRTEIGDGVTSTGIRWHNGEAAEVDFNMIYDINGQGDAVGNWSNLMGRDRAAKITANDELYMLPFPGSAGQSIARAVSGDGTTIAGWISDAGDFEMPDYTPAVWHCEE